MVDFPVKTKKIWEQWQLRASVICSLALQIFLIFSASSRNHKSKPAKLIRPIIWLAYLAADAVAIFALGLLSDHLKGSNDEYNDLVALWAPFLLLHLGGPDTITAYALEDNELWPRHFLFLGVELVIASYVFVRTLPKNNLLAPTLLIFLVGIIRYSERTIALYLASMDGFKNSIPRPADPGVNYAKFMEELKLNNEAGIPASIVIPDEYPAVMATATEGGSSDGHLEEVMVANAFFTTFKRLIADLLLRFNESKESRELLLSRSPDFAFKIMDIELVFVYDILFTKAAVIHNRTGYITRAVGFASILVSLSLFCSSSYTNYLIKGKNYLKAEILITYALLVFAAIMDIAALYKLISSDWTFISLDGHPKIRNIVHKLVIRRKREIRISQYNLIGACLYNYAHKKLSQTWWVGAKFLDSFIHTSDLYFDEHLKEFIFVQLKNKSKHSEDLEGKKHLCSRRGSWALEQLQCLEEFGWTVDCNGGVELEESILLWHIATDLCHKSIEDRSDLAAKHCGISKVLSEYMMYLLIQHPSMISSMEGIRQIKYKDACEEATSVVRAQNLAQQKKSEVYAALTEVSSDMVARSKLVFFDACYLYKLLNGKQVDERWEIISSVWGELLTYAACQCRGKYHAQGLIRGGELITYVWLLMAHLGFGQQFHEVSSHAKAKVIVEK